MLDENGRPRNHDVNYAGHELTNDELFDERNLNFSGLNLEKQNEAQIDVSDFSGALSKEDVYRGTFVEMGLEPQLMENLKRLKWTSPTPIQKYAVSILSGGRDLMAAAQTGSGKTGAMLIPTIGKGQFLSGISSLDLDFDPNLRLSTETGSQPRAWQ